MPNKWPRFNIVTKYYKSDDEFNVDARHDTIPAAWLFRLVASLSTLAIVCAYPQTAPVVPHAIPTELSQLSHERFQLNRHGTVHNYRYGYRSSVYQKIVALLFFPDKTLCNARKPFAVSCLFSRRLVCN